ncbi:hypothetical protein ScPMuIL_018052 [Solemya velum]
MKKKIKSSISENSSTRDEWNGNNLSSTSTDSDNSVWRTNPTSLPSRHAQGPSEELHESLETDSENEAEGSTLGGATGTNIPNAESEYRMSESEQMVKVYKQLIIQYVRPTQIMHHMPDLMSGRFPNSPQILSDSNTAPSVRKGKKKTSENMSKLDT